MHSSSFLCSEIVNNKYSYISKLDILTDDVERMEKLQTDINVLVALSLLINMIFYI